MGVTDWQIQTRSKACRSCSRPFDEGDVYWCVLAEGENVLAEGEALERSDYCASCWAAGSAAVLKAPEVISTWRGRVPPKLVPPDEPIKRTTAESLLSKYLHSSNASEKNFCYILGLILERKRVLRPRQVLHEESRGARLVVYEHVRSGEIIVIEDPRLGLAELQQIHSQVAAILEQEKVSAV
jgi:hypothetical protein